LALYGLRRVPFVGRVAERDALWRTLVGVADTGLARAVVLHGEPGVGKSRLARWLCERGHEVGACEVLRAVHGPTPSPLHGLAFMVRRHLQCEELSGDPLLAHLSQRLGCEDEPQLKTWAALIDPDDEVPPRYGVRLGERARHTALLSLLERLSRTRTVVLWLEDVHWGRDALAFLKLLVPDRAVRRLPVLAVCTTRDDLLAARPREAALVAELEERPGVTRLDLDPLTDRSQRDLVEGLLGLRGELAVQVRHRTAGNPGFAVELVGDWVARQLLVPSDHGFRLQSPEIQPSLPATLFDASWSRLEQLLATRTPADREALWVAAILGDRIQRTRWGSVCRAAGLSPHPQLVARLSKRALAHESNDGRWWRLAHLRLREALLDEARRSPRWAELQRTCAEVLGAETPVPWAAVGSHQLAAGLPEQALGSLLRAIATDHDPVELGSSLLAATRAIDQLELPPSDPRHTRLATARSRNLVLLGRLTEALAIAEEAVVQARAHDHHRLLPAALVARGEAHRQLGDLAAAERDLREALACGLAIDDPKITTHAQLELGWLAMWRGNAEVVLELLEQGRPLVDRLPAFGRHADFALLSAAASIHLERLDDAERWADEAERGYAASGRQDQVAAARSMRASVLQRRGDLDGAAALQLQTIELADRFGSQYSVLARMNLAVVLITQEHFAEALEIVRETRASPDLGARRHLIGALHVLALPCLAASGRWQAFAAELEAAEADLRAVHNADQECAELSRQAGDMAAAAGHPELAAGSWRLSLMLWERLGSDEEARDTHSRLSR
jgi:tetratricopeptide (TPR) repeat protein